MFYHRESKRVVRKFKIGIISKVRAFSLLRDIEENAYRKIPDAEPDGDITYCVACALEEIDEHNNSLNPTTKE
jgi:hypothetical protein